MDLDDSPLYDLVINTGKINYDSAKRLIIEATKGDEINTCSLTALEAMEKLSVIKKVQASLVENNLDSNLMFVNAFL